MAVSDQDAVKEQPANHLREPITVSQPLFDPYFTRNERIIQDLLVDEHRYHSLPGLCSKQSLERAIWMRRALLNWLRDICIHRGTDGEVLAHTAQLVDRYMRVVSTDQQEYQLVGAACFFISSKLKEPVPIPLRVMAEYSAYSAAEQDILAKELTICISLNWDLTCITPVDFIAPVVEFLNFVPRMRKIIRQAALCIYVKAFHVEALSAYLPSYTAAACILYALNLTVQPELNGIALQSIAFIQRLLGLEPVTLRRVYEILQACFEPGTVELSKAVRDGDLEPPESPLKQSDLQLNTHRKAQISLTSTNETIDPNSRLHAHCTTSLRQSVICQHDSSSLSASIGGLD